MDSYLLHRNCLSDFEQRIAKFIPTYFFFWMTQQ